MRRAPLPPPAVTPAGPWDSAVTSVKEANLMVARCVLLLCLVMARGGVFVLENPKGSLLDPSWINVARLPSRAHFAFVPLYPLHLSPASLPHSPSPPLPPPSSSSTTLLPSCLLPHPLFHGGICEPRGDAPEISRVHRACCRLQTSHEDGGFRRGHREGLVVIFEFRRHLSD